MDKDLRRDFDNICQELGVTMVFGVEEQTKKIELFIKLKMKLLRFTNVEDIMKINSKEHNATYFNETHKNFIHRQKTEEKRKRKHGSYY